MPVNLTLEEVADLVSGELRGDGSVVIGGIAPLSSAKPGDLTWVASEKFARQLEHSQASAALVAPQFANCRKTPVVICEKPELAIVELMEQFLTPAPHPPVGVDPTAIVAQGVSLGENVAIGPLVVVQREARVGKGSILHAGSFVGEACSIGEECVIWPHVVIRERCSIGNRVMIHPNCTIGADGFGYNFSAGAYRKIPHIGTVRIEDDVEIGAGSCVDRAKCGETIIGRGTKIDNQVQIAHNVKIGEHCCIISQTGIAGSTTLGDHVVLAGKVGVRDNIIIGSRVQVAACSCIARDVPDGAVLLGIPAVDKRSFFKERAVLRRLPEMVEEIRSLRQKVEQLEAANHSQTR